MESSKRVRRRIARMTGRKQRKETENEMEHEYVLHQKIEAGEKRTGTLGEELDDMGAVGEVKRRREEYEQEYLERHGRAPRGGE